MHKSEKLGFQLIDLAQQSGKSVETIAEEIIAWADGLTADEFCEVHAIAETIVAAREMVE
jgi:hypothetical protein